MKRGKITKGEIATSVVFTLATTSILALAGIIYKSLTTQLDNTTALVTHHDTEIALVKQTIAPLPNEVEEIKESVQLILKNQAVMGAVQGIKLATTTP